MSETALILQTIIVTVAAGVVCQILSERLRIPSIFFLLASGILLGPHFAGIIVPATVEAGLLTIIELGVAIILFEGSLFLHLDQFHTISLPIRRLLTLGAAITFVGSVLAAHFIIGLPLRYSIVFGALMIVTGPTVIGPILKRLPLKPRLATVLNWESVLLDPIGAVLAIIFMEFLLAKETSWFVSLWQFFWIIAAGVGIGFIVGWALRFFVRKNENLSHESMNLTILAGALITFGLAHMIAPHSGLISVVVAGMVLANCEIFTQRAEIKEFHGTISTLVVSLLFVLLAAKLNVDEVIGFGESGWWLLGAMLLVVRPLSVFISTRGSGLKLGEKLFLSWMAPRGIVAASTASLFALILLRAGHPDAAALESLTYLVISATVILHGLPAGLTAKLFRALEAERTGYLIIGAHALGRQIGRWLQERGIEVKLIDSNPRYIRKARQEGLMASTGNALDPYYLENLGIKRIGTLLALTSSDEVNALACQLGDKLLGEGSSYQIAPRQLRESHELTKEMVGKAILPQLPYLGDIGYGLEEGRYEWQEIELTQEVSCEGPLEIAGGTFWPLFQIKKSSCSLITGETKLKSGDSIAGVHSQLLKK